MSGNRLTEMYDALAERVSEREPRARFPAVETDQAAVLVAKLTGARDPVEAALALEVWRSLPSGRAMFGALSHVPRVILVVALCDVAGLGLALLPAGEPRPLAGCAAGRAWASSPTDALRLAAHQVAGELASASQSAPTAAISAVFVACSIAARIADTSRHSAEDGRAIVSVLIDAYRWSALARGLDTERETAIFERRAAKVIAARIEDPSEYG